MNKYRPTTLRLASQHCPRAVDYYEQKRPYFRDHYAVGIAAHAVLEALGHAAVAWRGEGACLPPSQREEIAQGTIKRLITKGRTFDGSKEPPISPDAAFEGRELALWWANSNPLSNTARYELGAGFTRDWEPVGYDDPRARFRLIFDVLDVVEESTEESGTKGILVRDYKTAWSADAGELDSLQMRAQAVCAVDLMCRSLTESDYAFVRQEIVNLRTSQTYSRTLWLDGMGDGSEGDGVAMLAQWQKDLTMAMDALDEMRPCKICSECDGHHHWMEACPDPEETYDKNTECLPHWQCKHCDATIPYDPDTEDGFPTAGSITQREARPGLGCAGCPWVASCEEAKNFLAAMGTHRDPSTIAARLAASQALTEDLGRVARHALDEREAIEAGGYVVGYATTSRREPIPDAAIHLLDKWTAQGGDARGLVKALSPGVAALESAAKILLPGKEKKAERDSLVATLTRMKIRKSFGVFKKGDLTIETER